MAAFIGPVEQQRAGTSEPLLQWSCHVYQLNSFCSCTACCTCIYVYNANQIGPQLGRGRSKSGTIPVCATTRGTAGGRNAPTLSSSSSPALPPTTDARAPTPDPHQRCDQRRDILL